VHFVVPLKQVFDPNTPPVQLRIGADARSLELPSGASPIMNGYDANAVEAAIALKEKHGGTLSVLSVGDESCKNALRRALAMGADRAIHVVGPSGLAADSALIAALLAAAIRKLPGADLILCGRQASDTDAGQVPMLLAVALDLPAVSPVRAISLGDGAAIADRIAEGATQRLEVKLPALLCVSNEINKPRPTPLKGVMLAKKADIPSWSAADLGLGETRPALVLRRLSFPPVAETRAELIAGATPSAAGTALAERLRLERMI
jgi:electron transfer flavoprotein beta subunit